MKLDRLDIDGIIKKEIERDRRSEGMKHHPKSVELMRFLCDVDFKAYGDYFGWKMGGDGDNGETLMLQMDAWFEYDEARQG